MTTPSFEDSVHRAVVERFFDPDTRFTPMQIAQPDGTYRTDWSISQQKSPLQIVAENIFAAKRNEIMRELSERITPEMLVDAMVPMVVKQMMDRFDASKDTSWHKPSEAARKEMRERVMNLLVQEFGKRAVEFLQQTGGLAPVLGYVVPPAEAVDPV